MADRHDVTSFTRRIQQRVNRVRMIHGALVAIALGGGATLLAALAFVATGHRVPAALYVAMALVTAAAATAAAWRSRVDARRSAALADRHFALSDSIASCLAFSQLEDRNDFHMLQAEHAKAQVTPLDPDELPTPLPRRLGALAAVLVVAGVLLGFLPPSQSVLAAEQLAAETAARTAELNEDIRTAVEELIEELEDDDVDEPLIDPAELREWVEQLQDTEDPLEAMRAYAELESKFEEAARDLDGKAETQAWDEIGRELAEQPRSRELGRALEERRYDDAKEALEDLEPPTDESIENAKEEAERLHDAASTMAETSRQRMQRQRSDGNQSDRNSSRRDDGQRSSNESSSDSPSSNEPSEGEPSEHGELSEAEQSLQELLDELEDAAESLDQKVGECQACKNGGEGDPEAAKAAAMASASEAAERLDALKKRLSKLDAKRGAASKMKSMARALGQCQGCVGDGNSPGENPFRSMSQSPNAGGIEAGMGSSGNTSNEATPDSEGALERLQGVHGEGPSQTTIEQASSGTGTQRAGRRAVDRDAQQEIERFVSREDVPESVTGGVREYFESIHGTRTTEEGDAEGSDDE